MNTNFTIIGLTRLGIKRSLQLQRRTLLPLGHLSFYLVIKTEHLSVIDSARDNSPLRQVLEFRFGLGVELSLELGVRIRVMCFNAELITSNT